MFEFRLALQNSARTQMDRPMELKIKVPLTGLQLIIENYYSSSEHSFPFLIDYHICMLLKCQRIITEEFNKWMHALYEMNTSQKCNFPWPLLSVCWSVEWSLGWSVGRPFIISQKGRKYTSMHLLTFGSLLCVVNVFIKGLPERDNIVNSTLFNICRKLQLNDIVNFIERTILKHRFYSVLVRTTGFGLRHFPPADAVFSPFGARVAELAELVQFRWFWLDLDLHNQKVLLL